MTQVSLRPFPLIRGVQQVQARQSESLTRARVFMNHLWLAESEGKPYFDPEQTPVYASGGGHPDQHLLGFRRTAMADPFFGPIAPPRFKAAINEATSHLSSVV